MNPKLIGGLICVAIGLLLCLAGYRTWRSWLFLMGAAFGFSVGGLVFHLFKGSSDGIGPVIAAGISAILGGALFAAIVPLGTFLTVLSLGAEIAIGIAQPQRAEEAWKPAAIGAAVGFLPALAAAIWRRPGAILYTSFAGGCSLTLAILGFLEAGGVCRSASEGTVIAIAIVGPVLFGLGGTFFQFATTRPARRDTMSGDQPAPPLPTPPSAGSGSSPGLQQAQSGFYCTACGTHLEEGSRFCVACGRAQE